LLSLYAHSVSAPGTAERYSLSLHDALPICACVGVFALQVLLLGLGLSGLGLGGLAIDVIRHELDPGAPAPRWPFGIEPPAGSPRDRKSTRLNSSHVKISYAVFCLKKKTKSG